MPNKSVLKLHNFPQKSVQKAIIIESYMKKTWKLSQNITTLPQFIFNDHSKTSDLLNS